MITSKPPAISVITPARDAYTETFIRAHIERLPAEVHVLYGASLPTHADEGEPLIPKYGLLRRLRFRLHQQLRGLSWDERSKQVAAIEQFLRRNQVKAVLAEYGPTGVEMMEVCQRVHVPLVVHFFGFDAYRNDILVEGAGRHYAALFAVAAAIIVVSRDMEQQLIHLGAPPEKLHYIPCGADTRLFQVTDASANLPNFVAVGRFVDKKAPYLTLLAFRRVVSEIPEARLVMVGDGPLWETCQRLAQALGLSEVVDFPGRCSHSEMAELLQTARAFVQHSVTALSGDSEGTPVAILEAGASGLPVVATRHAGIKDVVIHEQTGLLGDEGDAEEMGKLMLRLALDAPLAGRLGRAARAHVEQHFRLDDTLAQLWQVIESVRLQ